MFYVTPEMYKPFTSRLLSFTGPLTSSRVASYLSRSPSISRVPSSPSRVPFHFHRSPSIFRGPILSFTGLLPFHRSPSIFTGPLLSFTGPLLSLRDPSDKSIWVSKPSSQLLSHMTIYYDFRPMYYDIRPMHHDFRHSTWSSGFKANQIVITIWEAMHMYRDFSHSTLACHAHVL